MARTPRFDLPNTRHHVMNRGARRDPVFLDDPDCVTFLALLAELPGRFGVRVHGYALMPNHFHLMIECPVGGLGRAMQWIQSRYSSWLNLHHGWDGPVWRGRYRSLAVESDVWWAHLLAYLHLNPVAAHLVPTPNAARWTSHAAYAGITSAPGWLTRDELIGIFGSIQAYEAYVREVQIGRERGPDGFNPQALWRRPRGEQPSAPPETPTQARRPLSLDEAWRLMEAVTGMERAEILTNSGGRAGNPARWLAMDWLPRATGLTRAAVARIFGVDPMVISRAGARVRTRSSSAPLRGWVDALEAVSGV